MNVEDELRRVVVTEIEGGRSAEIVLRRIRELKDQGLSQEEAYRILMEIRESDYRANGLRDDVEDLFVDVLDVVWGRCSRSAWIWDAVLPNR